MWCTEGKTFIQHSDEEEEEEEEEEDSKYQICKNVSCKYVVTGAILNKKLSYRLETGRQQRISL